MRKKEADYQTTFNQYLREKRKVGEMYGFYELKAVGTHQNTFLFSRIESHQYTGLQATEQEGLVWKFSDEDQRQKPCDCVCIPPLPSYLVIKFSVQYYIIRIGEIVKLRDMGSISISEFVAAKVSEKILTLRA